MFWIEFFAVSCRVFMMLEIREVVLREKLVLEAQQRAHLLRGLLEDLRSGRSCLRGGRTLARHRPQTRLK
ncbi:hypothetical protein ACN28I_29285 [Archangium gephyra]|uniref:hypothetical protein n=1 Tax=Archangium gephyra TaxID=48 RepID=UPI003B763B1A